MGIYDEAGTWPHAAATRLQRLTSCAVTLFFMAASAATMPCAATPATATATAAATPAAASGASAAGRAGYYSDPAVHGDSVIFTSEGDLWSVDVHGGAAHRLTSNTGEESMATISPDG
jgi:streptogramin lyase